MNTPFLWLKWIDRARIVPRLMVLGYAYMVWTVVQWAMNLPTMSMEQAGIVSVVIGSGAAVFGLYTNSGQKWE